MLTTLLWCTFLIIYRILIVGRAAGRTHVYQRLIEMLVESASLYSVVIVVLLVLQVRNDGAGKYVEVFGITMRVCITCFYFFFVMTTTSLLGNRAYNFGRARCSRACASR